MMEDLFFIDTGNVDQATEKKSKKSKSKHKKEKTLEKESESIGAIDPSTLRYVSSDTILGAEAKKAEEAEDGDRPKGRRSMFRRSTNKRYHETSDGADAKPGILSDALRQALGLQRSQVPRFIYRMREIGYPPGWLKDAEKCQSSVSIVSEDQDHDKPVEYDLDKLVDFPGFNVPLPKGQMDEWRKLRCLPMQEHQSMEAMRQGLSQGKVSNFGENSYDRFMEEPSTSSISDRLTTKLGNAESSGRGGVKRRHKNVSDQDDMEVESDNDHLAANKASRLDANDTGSSSRNSVTSETELVQLEEERRRIIDQLNSTQADDAEDGDQVQDNGRENECLTDDDTEEDTKKDDSHSSDDKAPQSPLPASLGSPVFMAENSVLKVSDIHKFSQGIEEFRPYITSGEISGTFQKVMGALKEAKRGVSRKSFNS